MKTWAGCRPPARRPGRRKKSDGRAGDYTSTGTASPARSRGIRARRGVGGTGARATDTRLEAAAVSPAAARALTSSGRNARAPPGRGTATRPAPARAGPRTAARGDRAGAPSAAPGDRVRFEIARYREEQRAEQGPTITYDHVGGSRESNYVTAGSTWGGGWGPPRDRTRGAP